MKKTFKQLLISLLSVAMVFTMTAMPVYADEEAYQGEETIIEESLTEDVTEEITEEAEESQISEETADAVPEEIIEEPAETVPEDEPVQEPQAVEKTERTQLKAATVSVVLAEEAETVSDIDIVKEMISALPNCSDVTEADRAKIEAAEAAYEALTTEEQAQLDSEPEPTFSQPYGRVLESALWGLWSLNAVDNTTTLAPGTYDATTSPALTSSYSKGKSTSERNRPWSVKSITVDVSQHVTAVITVESSSYSGIIYGGKTYAKTNTSGNCEFEPIPIDLNSTFYFSGVSTSMARPIAFSLTTTIDETATEPV